MVVDMVRGGHTPCCTGPCGSAEIDAATVRRLHLMFPGSDVVRIGLKDESSDAELSGLWVASCWLTVLLVHSSLTWYR